MEDRVVDVAVGAGRGGTAGMEDRVVDMAEGADGVATAFLVPFASTMDRDLSG